MPEDFVITYQMIEQNGPRFFDTYIGMKLGEAVVEYVVVTLMV